jgi:hypothetical protein
MSEFNGPGPCTAMVRCSCSGHRFPGVSHLVPCCDQPHVDFGRDPFADISMIETPSFAPIEVISEDPLTGDVRVDY